jgi:hypothetical protein
MLYGVINLGTQEVEMPAVVTARLATLPPIAYWWRRIAA